MGAQYCRGCEGSSSHHCLHQNSATNHCVLFSDVQTSFNEEEELKSLNARFDLMCWKG